MSQPYDSVFAEKPSLASTPVSWSSSWAESPVNSQNDIFQLLDFLPSCHVGETFLHRTPSRKYEVYACTYIQDTAAWGGVTGISIAHMEKGHTTTPTPLQEIRFCGAASWGHLMRHDYQKSSSNHWARRSRIKRKNATHPSLPGRVAEFKKTAHGVSNDVQKG